jgi:Fe-S cluster biogenesis protein NfuA
MEIREEIERALALCRPALQRDQGDVEFLRITDDGIVELRFLGMCAVCPMSRMTLRAGIERVILRRVPGVRRVEEVSL